MKTVRALALLLLASVHIFAPVSSDGSNEPAATAAPPALPAATSSAAATPTTQPQAAPTQTHAAPTQTQAAPAQPHGDPITPKSSPLPPGPTSSSDTSPASKQETPPAAPQPEGPTVSPAANASQGKPELPDTATNKTGHMNESTDARTSDETSRNDTVQPRSHRPSQGNHTDGQTKIDIPLNETTRGPDDSTKTPSTDKVGPTPAPGKPETPIQRGDNTGPGPQTGNDEKEPSKSDKRLWWIVLPVLLVAAAAAIVLKFKCKKVHDHTETIDTGTENASFQSRPESTKDGVMLLGVKSSGGEENAAAR